ncbi:MAG: RNA polymerase sigma factor, partial [Gaiellales bacterium]
MAVALERSTSLPTRDAGALTASLYKQHAGELLRFAWHRLGRVEDAEDAVQATFLSAHRVLQEGERVREPRAWLFRILRNECLTRIAMVKRRGVHESLEEWHADPGPSVEEAYERRDAFDATVALLGTLPEQQREAMVLREWIGLSAVETSEVLETTPQGVDALVYRARKSLVAVPEVEDDSDCAEVRAALAEDAITARTRAHLLRCRSCRAASRRLRSPEEMAVNGTLPLDAVASRLGESIPGFALGAGTAAVAAGGGIAAAASSIAGASAAVKVVVGVTATAVVAGGTIGGVPVVRDAVRPALVVQQERITKRQASERVASGAKVTIVEAAAAQQVQPARVTTPVAAASAFPAEAVAAPTPEAPTELDGGVIDPPPAVSPAPAAEFEEPKGAAGAVPPASAAKPGEVKRPDEAKA